MRRRAALLLALAAAGAGCGPSIDRRQEERRLGAHGEDFSKVGQAQLILMYAGFPVWNVDGSLGPATREAVRLFQASRSLPATGYLGDRTWAELMKIERGAGPFVPERLQRGLRRAGFDPGPIDGQVGSSTRSALYRFQVSKGLDATGRLDPKTWVALRGSLPR